MQVYQRSTKNNTICLFEGYPNEEGGALAWSPDGTHLASAYAELVIQTWNPAQGRTPASHSVYPYRGPIKACSPDGHSFVTTQDNEIILWETATGSPVYPYTPGSPVEHVAWSPDGTQFVSASSAGSFTFWDVDTGSNRPPVDPVEDDAVSALGWSADGAFVFSAGGYDRGTLQLWSARTGRCLRSYSCADTGPLEGATTLACSPDGTSLLSGHWDGSIRLWCLSSISCLQVYHWHTGSVTALAWSPDGTQFVSGSSDGSLVVAHVFPEGPLQRYQEGFDTIDAVGWSRDGSVITSLSTRQYVCVWDALTGEKHVNYEGHPTGIRALSWSPDGTRIASQGSREAEMHIWNAKTGEPDVLRGEQTRSEWRAPRCLLGWSPDGRFLSSGQGSWDVETGQLFSPYTASKEPQGASWSPHGRYVAVMSGKHIDVYHWRKRQHIQTFTGHGSRVQELVWSADGERIASLSKAFPLLLWEARTGKLLRGYSGPLTWPYTLDWSADMASLACGGQQPSVILLDVTSGVPYFSYEEQTSSITVVRFAPKHARIASASRDRTVHVWHVL